MKRILITGCAGFIGSHLTEKLLSQGLTVVGIDNFDPFYDRSMKERNMLGFINHPNFTFTEADLADKQQLEKVFPSANLIVHLAGKAGVRPSIDDPAGYIRANILATQNILDLMQERGIKKMAFASSSSVYGNNTKTPFSEEADVSRPISPYAFTKKACELINYTFHHLYQFDIINMRFFTVFGPRQRPDLAIHKFTKLIRNHQPINMFGDGTTARDYTFIEDTLQGICASIDYLLTHENVFETINLGNNQPVTLRDMIDAIANATDEKPVINQLAMQPGDVDITFADISKANKLLHYQPAFNFNEGVKKFVEWYDEVNR
jgi:nucleoside-diphosphate-sugar epimerase